MFSILRAAGHRRSALVWWLGASMLGLLLACGDDSIPEPSGSPVTSPTQSAQADEFGPLAVIDSAGGSAARGGTGPLRVDDNCVTMTRENGETLMLIWHAAEVRWDEGNEEIIFSSAAQPEAGDRKGTRFYPRH